MKHCNPTNLIIQNPVKRIDKKQINYNYVINKGKSKKEKFTNIEYPHIFLFYNEKY